jgi:ubiquinone/menaquinone biosynthesis C-methylase UbiE
LLERFLPEAPAAILDVGGGPGLYACWLARKGYQVHLTDIVPLHVQQALQTSKRQPETPLASATVEDAVSLARDDASFDAVLLLGPLYHLTERADRIKALREAFRVLRMGGVLLAVGISRFASALDGIRLGLLKDPVFEKIVDQDLNTGQHRNPSDNPNYFTDAYFHHPDELREEVAEAGLSVADVYGLEGPSWLMHDLEEWLDDSKLKEKVLRVVRRLETEPSILGVSSHLFAVARKP